MEKFKKNQKGEKKRTDEHLLFTMILSPSVHVEYSVFWINYKTKKIKEYMNNKYPWVSQNCFELYVVLLIFCLAVP